MSDELSAAEIASGAFPSKAEFGCGRYADGSGPEITIGYDTKNPQWQHYIVIDGFTVTFDQKHAEEVIAAIRYCADALRNHLTKGTSDA
jgi:hypothetical protein